MKNKAHKHMYHGGVCLVTDRNSCCLTPVEMVHVALEAGIRWIQYRDKERSRLEFYRTARLLRELTLDFGTCFVVNDHADIAASVGADGVHLGQEDLPVKEARKILGHGRLIGISTHNLPEALRAEADGADYIGFGPVMPTRTKDAGPPGDIGIIYNQVSIPVVAIGGIHLGNLDYVLSSNIQAVAVASGILTGDIHCNAVGFLQRIQKCR